MTPRVTDLKPSPSNGTGVYRLASVALVLAALAVLISLILAYFTLNLIGDNRDLAHENQRQNQRIGNNQVQIRNTLHELQDAVRRLQRLEHPTKADFRRLLRSLLEALRGNDKQARQARRAVRRVLLPLTNQGGDANGGGSPPPG